MLKYLHEHYGNKFEWFMRADDDIFVKTERLELFLKNINSSKPYFIGQAGQGIQEEFGLLSLEYDENFCMGGPGIVFSHVTLALVAPNVKDCLKNLYTTHEDVELGRCVQKYAGIPCTWSYEMQSIFYHNSSGQMAFTGPLKSREVHRAITLHPVKQHAHMYRIHNYLQGLKIQDRLHQELKIRREMATWTERLQKRVGQTWIHRIGTSSNVDAPYLGLPPTLNKFVAEDENQLLVWNFLTRAVFSPESANPRRRIDAPLREGLDDVIREVMESINTLSKERGRIIDFKELLYGYYRLDPRHGIDYILDMLLVYKKYRGRKSTFPVRRHAYLQQPFGPLTVRSIDPPTEPADKIHLILPLAGRIEIFGRFIERFERVCLAGENVRLVIVLYPAPADDGSDSRRQIRALVEASRRRVDADCAFDVAVIERTEDFARAAALELGAATCAADDDCLLFFIDVDMVFDAGALRRIRAHTIRRRQVYFPVVFSQYDPHFATNGSHSTDSDVFRLDPDVGYWRYYGFGIASMFRSDLRSVGGFNLTIRGWGNEDVDLFDRLVRSDLIVFRAPDPGLVHVHHAIHCDVSLEPKQLEMCHGTRVNSFASQQRLAQLWIERRETSSRPEKSTLK